MHETNSYNVIDLLAWRQKYNLPIYPDYIVRIAKAIRDESALQANLDAVIDALNNPQ